MKRIIKGIKNTFSSLKKNKEFNEKLKELIKTGDMTDIYSMWIKADSKVQMANRKLFPQIVEKLDEDFIPEIIKNTDKYIIKKSIDSIDSKIKKTDLKNVWKLWNAMDVDIKMEKPDMFLTIFKRYTDVRGNSKNENREDFSVIWIYTEEEIKNKYIDMFPTILENARSQESLVRLICHATPDIITNNIELVKDIVKEIDNEDFCHIWGGFEKSIQIENIDLLIERFNTINNEEDLKKIWWGTKIKNEKIQEIFNGIDDVRKTHIWIASADWIQEKNRNLLGEMLENIEDPNLLSRIFLGTRSKMSELKKMKIPDELKKILLDRFQEKDRCVAEHYLDQQPLIDSMTVVMSNWDSVKEYIQRKRANSIVYEGIEVRRNSFREIVDAGKVLNRPILNNASAQELTLIAGAERIGTDTKFTNSVSTTCQRAFDLARRMDEEPTIKKYPDFSVKNEDEGIHLHVLHPQDKSAILLGYDTECCFRPNGNADNSAQNEYSMFQYCLTTPYGGVLRCENVQNNDIYMGTPFLVNGNCLMLHSYETGNGKKSDEVNKLLVKSAIKAIQDSNGSIDIVFMTDLNAKEKNRLDISDKVIIPSYFIAYTEGEYKNYENMYNNLEQKNCILAAKVGNQILSGEELVEWYKEKCGKDPDKLEAFLNLHMGERSEEWDFGRRKIKENIRIPELKLVQAFLKRKEDLEKAREDIAIKLHNAPDEEKDKFRKELKKNREEQLRIYSGEDIDLIAEVYGVDLEGELRKRAEENINSKKPKDKKKGGEGKAISILMARTRESKDKRVKGISRLNEKIAKNQITDEELEILEQAGVDVTEYRKVFRENSEVIQTGNSEAERNAQINEIVRKGMKNTAQKEEIVAEKLFERVTEEEIKAKAKRILNISMGDTLRRRTAELRRGKELEELTESQKLEINKEVQKMDLKSLVYSIVEGTITEEEQQLLDELTKGEYKFDLNFQMSKIEDKEKIKREIRNDKLAKLKAVVTLGIDSKQKITEIKGRVDGTRSECSDVTSLVYGNSWYIALDDNNSIIQTNINSEIDKNGLEKEYYEETLAEFQKDEKQEIQLSSVKATVQDVSLEDKKKAKRMLEKTKNDESVIKM